MSLHKAKLIPVQYRNKKYPVGITPEIIEVPAHFDASPLSIRSRFSLHTEYSYGPRKFSSSACKGLGLVSKKDRYGVPKLWLDKEWVKDFIKFITAFVGNNSPPEVIEIHPPFSDYCTKLANFVELYKQFEEFVILNYKNTKVLIENRYGSQYVGGDFLISNLDDLLRLTELIEKLGLKLRIALDLPQLFTAHKLEPGSITVKDLRVLFKKIKDIRDFIDAIHLWGKCYGKNRRLSSHMGNLDSYFLGLDCGDTKNAKESVPLFTERVEKILHVKTEFLILLRETFADKKERYFLPEVNSRDDDLKLIVNDLIEAGFEFI